MFYVVVLILVLLIYVAWEGSTLLKNQAKFAAFVQAELQEIKAHQEVPLPPSLAYGWFDGGWPVEKVEQEDRAPLKNPQPHRSADDYATQTYVLEYKSLASAFDRKNFLLQLSRADVFMKPALLDVVFADESASVRAWAAAHLDLDFRDYTGWSPREPFAERPPKIRDFVPALLADPEPIVRAALWSNPEFPELPWDIISIPTDWKERFRSMNQLDRLGLMRNPQLSPRYVVALLDAASSELDVSGKEHADILVAAAANPGLVGGSRTTGREDWMVDGSCNSPFEEYGQMWNTCLDKWLDTPRVCAAFIQYIQTTPEVKLSAYNRLLDDSNLKWLRGEVIRSCDPFIDKQVLILATSDQEEECRKVATERIGRFGRHLGLKKPND